MGHEDMGHNNVTAVPWLAVSGSFLVRLVAVCFYVFCLLPYCPSSYFGVHIRLVV